MRKNEILGICFVLCHLLADYIGLLEDNDKQHSIFTRGFKHLAKKLADQCLNKLKLLDASIKSDQVEEMEQYNMQLDIIENFVKSSQKHGMVATLTLLQDFQKGDLKIMEEGEIKKYA